MTKGYTGHPKALRPIQVEKANKKYTEVILFWNVNSNYKIQKIAEKMQEIIDKQFDIEPIVAN